MSGRVPEFQNRIQRSTNFVHFYIVNRNNDIFLHFLRFLHHTIHDTSHLIRAPLLDSMVLHFVFFFLYIKNDRYMGMLNLSLHIKPLYTYIDEHMLIVE